MKRLGLLLLCAPLLACRGGTTDLGQGGAKPSIRFPVEVTSVATERVEYAVRAVGSIDAFERQQVTARVAGAIDRVAFSEGDFVAKGKVLVEIEPERYQVALRSARAALERIEAARAEAEAALLRREEAVAKSPGSIPAEELDSFRTRIVTTTAEISAARAGVDLAQLNLRDAYVRAPTSGILDTRTVQTGQYVQAAAVLATIVRREPLLLRFQVPEADAARIRPAMTARFRLGHEERELAATISHVAQAADPVSRMVQVTAEVTAAEKPSIRPGTFAEVTVPVGVTDDAPIVPQGAIRPSERGFLAYVVEGDLAKERVVTLGMRTVDGKVESRAGLGVGEQLVIRGAEALHDGAPVRVAGAKPAGEAPRP